ncbi:MAG: ATP-dependent helicase, partial [Cyanobium sp.]
MSLLHATWLFPTDSSGGRLLLWADTWRAVDPVRPDGATAPVHPFSLVEDDLAVWLDDQGLWSEALRPARASLTLPSRSQALRGGARSGAEGWCGLPLQAGEPVPRQVQWWPWRVDGLALEPGAAAEWLSALPLSGEHPGLADDLRWWT